MSSKKKKNKNKKNHQNNQKNTDLPVPEPIMTVRRNIVNTSTTPPAASVIIIDNFYNNPMQTRESVLKQEFKVRGNYPGVRTVSFATDQLKDIIQQYVYPFGGKITMFPTEKHEKNYNGAFQITTCRDRSWFHVDSWNNWAGVLYLTPNAPVNGGTGLYRFEDGTRFDFEQKLRNNEYDAIILSLAGLDRLNLDHLVTEVLEHNLFLPAACQGAVGVQAIKESQIKEIFSSINDARTQIECLTERRVLKKINASCNSPVSVYAKIINNQIQILFELYNHTGQKIFQKSVSDDMNNHFELSDMLSNEVIKTVGQKKINELDDLKDDFNYTPD